jgi:putative hemolysin
MGLMSIILLFLTFIVFVALILIASLRPSRSGLSKFELERRSKQNNAEATRALSRENLLVDIISLQRIFIALLLVVFVMLSVITFGWLIGVLVALFVALEYGAIARLSFLRKLSLKLYSRFEKSILNFIKKAPVLFAVIRSVPIDNDSANGGVSSREELQYIIDESAGILTEDERKLLVHGLSFSDRLVSSIMTPKTMIDSIKNTEFLGPLALDDLHKTGHSRLPVTKGDIDHVIGILHLNNLLSLDVKRSTTAEKAMEARVFYIRQDQTLQHALSAFLRTKHHLFIVVNEFRETVGLLSLEDVIEALLGRKIVDEFDEHDNLRQVALRNPHDNNQPANHTNV